MIILTTRDLSEKMKMTKQTVRNFIKSGKLPAIKLGRQFRVTQADFEQFLINQRIQEVENGN